MGLKKIVKKGISFGFQPKRWFGVDHVAANGKICTSLVADMLIQDQKTAQPDLAADEEFTKDPSALRARQQLAIGLMGLYFISGLSGVGYTLYLWLAKGFFLPGSVSLVLSLVLFSYVLREFMVYGQIRCGGGRLPLKKLLYKLFSKKCVNS